MLKTISAALIAASMLAAPAMAAGLDRGAATHNSAPAAHHVQVRPSVLNANAKMMHRHHEHHRHARPHLRFHKKLGMHKTFKHTAIKTTAAHIKRG